MSTQEFTGQIEGYDQIQNEIEVLRKYGFDRSLDRGKVARQIDLLHPKTVRLRVGAVLQETRTTKTLRLVASDGYLPPFQAGQYINLFADVRGIRTSRPYSISSPPNQTGYWDVTVREVRDGFVSNMLLNDVQTGDCFTSSSPTGNFYHNPLYQGKDVVYLAGGSGITPFMSMIREVTDRGLDRRIHLIYGCRNEDDIIFQQELAERSRRHRNLSVSLVISDPSPECSRLTGFITAELIKRLVEDISSNFFFVCGPEVMYSFCLRELEKLGVFRRRIRTEVFGPPADVTGKPGWPADVGQGFRFSSQGPRNQNHRGPRGRTVDGVPGAVRARAAVFLQIGRMQPVPDQAGVGQGVPASRGQVEVFGPGLRVHSPMPGLSPARP